MFTCLNVYMLRCFQHLIICKALKDVAYVNICFFIFFFILSVSKTDNIKNGKINSTVADGTAGLASFCPGLKLKALIALGNTNTLREGKVFDRVATFSSPKATVLPGVMLKQAAGRLNKLVLTVFWTGLELMSAKVLQSLPDVSWTTDCLTTDTDAWWVATLTTTKEVFAISWFAWLPGEACAGL